VLLSLTPGSPSADSFVSSMETRDDAGFIPFGGGLLLQSVDFFPPIVDDPYRFGQIAAANALSDVYAMGGYPLTAMNLVGFPGSLDLGVLREILAGGQSKIEESGARLCGGHSVQDEEPKYGLSVTGFVEEDRVVRNVGAKAGDALVLTKPLGFGILTTALKRDLVSEAEIEDAVEAAASLNKAACAALREVEVSAATDVTGYGFLGHLSEMLEASTLGAVVHRGGVPVWERSVSLAAEGYYPGGLKNNREYLGEKITADGVGPEALLPLYDPQTSGGLLVAVPQDRAPAFVRALEGRDTLAAVVGEVVESQEIRVVP
jgi:selenide,water dikinase